VTDPFERLRELRPPVPDEDGWAASAVGRAALARVLAAPAPARRRWWRRKSVVVPSVLLGLGGAVAAGAAFAPAGREPDRSAGVVCVGTTSDGAQSFSSTSLAAGADHAAIVAACNAVVRTSGNRVPVDWAECVYPAGRDQAGGAEVAVPSDVVVTMRNHATQCQRVGFEPLR
jgi:hypothetical protein